jgi:hypothetical protein
MAAICSYETSVDTQRTIRRYVPEAGILLNHRRENLKSYVTYHLKTEFLLNNI